MKKLIVLLLMLTISTSVSAAEIPQESLPSNATFECMEYTESLISDILDQVQNEKTIAAVREVVTLKKKKISVEKFRELK